MTLLLNPRVWIALALAVALAFTHGFAYKSGRAAVGLHGTLKSTPKLKRPA